MIISASRRTDIPAFFAEWFMQRIRAGFCLVPNPFNANQVSRVSLDPSDVDAIVFWSKNPARLLSALDELDQRGYRYYFQVTLNDYPSALEPHLPACQDRVATFQALARRLGPERVIWRYDPIILSNHTNANWHRARFRDLLASLGTSTHRVVLSVVDLYSKTRAALRRLEAAGFTFPDDPLDDPDLAPLLLDMARDATAAGLEVTSCAEPDRLAPLGIQPGACIDGALINRLRGEARSWSKDPYQRPACRCVASRDIGVFNTCPAGCVYCYAAGTRPRRTPADPCGPSL